MRDRSSKRKRGRGSTRPLSRGCRLPACNGSSFAPRGVDAGGDGVGVLLESWVKDRSCYLHQLQRLAARTLLSCCNCNSHCLSGGLSTRCAVGQRAGSDRCTSARRTADVHVGTIESHPYRLALHCCCIQRASPALDRPLSQAVCKPRDCAAASLQARISQITFLLLAHPSSPLASLASTHILAASSQDHRLRAAALKLRFSTPTA